MMKKWKKDLKAVADNPNFIEENIKAIKKELKHNYPQPRYLREKVRNINTWIDEIEKFNTPKLAKVI
jgi:mRNA-degrading endonuclease YafQ of YafQ-DinJ toxin-antitoxin module